MVTFKPNFFAPALAQLRFDAREPDLLVDFFFGFSGNPLVVSKHAIFIKLQPSIL